MNPSDRHGRNGKAAPGWKPWARGRGRGVLASALVLALLQALAGGMALAAPGTGSGPTPIPATVVNVAGVPAPGTGGNAVPHLPFLPSNATLFHQAKSQAAQPGIGRRTSVVDLAGSASGARTAVAQGTAQGVGVASHFPAMSQNIQVSQFGADQNIYPPDPVIAAGTVQGSVYGQVYGDILVQFTNDTGSIWTTSGSLIKAFDLNQFFLGSTVDPSTGKTYLKSGYAVTDPQVFFDTQSGRWFASAGAFNSDYAGQVFLAVSQTSDPTALWDVYPVLSAPSNTVVRDFPHLGVSSDLAVLTWNNFDIVGGNATFTGAEAWAVDKADLLNGLLVGSQISQLSQGNYYTLMPAQETAGNGGVEYVVVNLADPTIDYSTTPAVGVFAVTGSPANKSLSVQGYKLPIAPTTIPPNAAQPGNGPGIATNDDSFIFANWRNGVLWTGGNDACVPPTGDGATHSCLRLVQISAPAGGASQPQVLQDFDASVPGADVYYPNAITDGNGNMYVVYTQSSTSMYPSVAVSGQLQGWPAGSVEPSVVVQPGQGAYASVGGEPETNRWGDYMGAAIDPANPGSVWVVGEYSPAAVSPDVLNGISGWATAVAHLSVQTATPAPGGGTTATETLTLSAPPTVPSGGSAVLTGTLTDSGLPVSGATVQFQAPGGSVSPPSVTTSVYGTFSAVFQAPAAAGPAPVTAVVAGSDPPVTAAATVTVTGASKTTPLWLAQITPTFARLNGVAAADASHVVAVGKCSDGDADKSCGSNPSAVYSTDGGRDWSQAYFYTQDGKQMTPPDLNAVSMPDATHAWAVGPRGTVLFSPYGGASWGEIAAPTTHNLSAVAFVNDGLGWVAGRDNNGHPAIFETQDGGGTWTKVWSTTSDTPIHALYFLDATHGWAVGSGGLVLTWNGTSWTQSQIAASAPKLHGVDFLNASDGWAVGQHGAVYATSDGGSSWQSLPFPDTIHTVRSVQFVDAQHGWVATQAGVVWGTNDGGNTWQAQSSLPAQPLTALAFAGATHGWAVGRYGTVLTYAPGPWQTAALVGPSTVAHSVYKLGGGARNFAFGGVSFPTASDGWTVGSQGWYFGGVNDDGVVYNNGGRSSGIYQTTNGGLSWTRALNLGLKADLTFPASQTTSGQSVTFCRPPVLDSVVFPDPQHGWAVGGAELPAATGDNPCSSAHAIRTAIILATSDGGQTWTLQNSFNLQVHNGLSVTTKPTPVPVHLHAVTFLDDQHGWAVGQGDTILATSNGGQTWTVQEPASGLAGMVASLANLQGVSFVDNNGAYYGWAVGQGGLIWATQNGGQNWVRQSNALPNSLLSIVSSLNAVQFINPQDGWIVGTEVGAIVGQAPAGLILATTDGGQTWTIQASSGLSVLGEDATGPLGIHNPTDIPLALTGVHFTDPQHGWAVGADYTIGGNVGPVGGIWTTSDGGQIWSPDVPSLLAGNPDPTGSGLVGGLNGIAATDANHAWAVGEFGQVLAYTGVSGASAGVTLAPPTATVASGQSVALTGSVIDGNNQPVVGATVTLSDTLGAIPAGTTVQTGQDGTFTYTYTAPTVATQAGDTVTASAGSGMSATSSLTVVPFPVTIASTQVEDANHNPVTGPLTPGDQYFLTMTVQSLSSGAMNPLYLVEATQNGNVLGLGSVQTTLGPDGTATATVSFTPPAGTSGTIHVHYFVWSDWLSSGGTYLAAEQTQSVQVGGQP